MMALFNTTALKCSKLITEHYSTSFTLGIKTLDRKFHLPIYAIYGFVRYADEIVDTFHEYDKKTLLDRFKFDTYQAIEEGISLNPILQSFQLVVKQYKIEHELIESFLKSMEMDLYFQDYDAEGYNEYIYGSAEVVGLMCLRVFCEGNHSEFDRLCEPARKLGSAFQKVNFLRDLKSDFVDRGRTYFPGVNFSEFGRDTKQLIEDDIQRDFDEAYKGILNLPRGARLGVYLAYAYYQTLFNKIKQLPASRIQNERIRVPNPQKFALLAQTYLKFRLNVI
ncbi:MULTISPECIES: phytoene/squalene synthase family protein [Spirosoma]|uniref:Phytoene/squalene synthase family protein n=1 Tax=Spirosoma liriopis TaxID=2937440 RepID=A0ABT0HI62_9BACT|nr:MULTISPECIES: phytoene/squalene synthase family protein [Spirosoma]MCK8491851.1 phytoene/squalene synthase family protein [Spirosoma liriopis]UHG91172.1 phytoene/squalene synthase family protein [Spirosoma oryzicola]